jgi:hypothetical protein
MFSFILFSFLSLHALASDQQVELLTPRGQAIQLDIYNPGQANLLILAPGQGCRPRLDIYDAIGLEGLSSGFTVVRLYWAYCIADPQNGSPSADLSSEKEDFLTTMSYAKNILGFSADKTFIGGKSLGTFVSTDIFLNEKLLRGLVLLTPVCTDSQSDPNNSRNTFAENYPGLSSEVRLVLLAQGNADLFCESAHFQNYVRGLGNNFVPLVASGNHGFGIQDPDGQYNSELGARNLRAISQWIFTWIK